jgi:hypothetical protein
MCGCCKTLEPSHKELPSELAAAGVSAESYNKVVAAIAEGMTGQ